MSENKIKDRLHPNDFIKNGKVYHRIITNEGVRDLLIKANHNSVINIETWDKINKDSQTLYGSKLIEFEAASRQEGEDLSNKNCIENKKELEVSQKLWQPSAEIENYILKCKEKKNALIKRAAIMRKNENSDMKKYFNSINDLTSQVVMGEQLKIKESVNAGIKEEIKRFQNEQWNKMEKEWKSKQDKIARDDEIQKLNLNCIKNQVRQNEITKKEIPVIEEIQKTQDTNSILLATGLTELAKVKSTLKQKDEDKLAKLNQINWIEKLNVIRAKEDQYYHEYAVNVQEEKYQNFIQGEMQKKRLMDNKKMAYDNKLHEEFLRKKEKEDEKLERFIQMSLDDVDKKWRMAELEKKEKTAQALRKDMQSWKDQIDQKRKNRVKAMLDDKSYYDLTVKTTRDLIEKEIEAERKMQNDTLNNTKDIKKQIRLKLSKQKDKLLQQKFEAKFIKDINRDKQNETNQSVVEAAYDLLKSEISPIWVERFLKQTGTRYADNLSLLDKIKLEDKQRSASADQSQDILPEVNQINRKEE